jgi:hypothetical protein
VGGRAEDADAAVGVLDDGEDVHARAVQGGGGEEVAGQDRVGLATQESSPALAVAFGSGLDPVRPQDLPYRGGCELDAEGSELAVDLSVAPPGILPGQAQDESPDAAGGTSRPKAGGG